MRISDWSSDVCSSDLPRDYPLAEGAGEVGDLFTWPAVVEDRNITGYHSIAVPGHVAGMGLAWERYGSIDRKSVVEGKSVSVRVDLGGRRTITKKNAQN